MTVDQVVLWQTDEAAEARGLTRSAFIESGLATVIDGRNRRTSMAATHLPPSGSTNDHSRK